MNRFTGLLAVVVLGFTLAWAQAPAAAPAQAAAPTQQASVSGCMTQYYGHFSVADASSKAWQIKGNGARLWDHENHVVRIQGLPDPAAAGVIYVQNVQDTGQACGNAQAANANPAQPGTAPVAGNTAAGTAAATNAAAPNTNPNAATAGTQPEPQPQPGGGVAQPNEQPQAPPAPQASTPETPSQGGVSGAATPQASTGSEDKGVPTAGTPQNGSIASNSTPQRADNNQIFTGCLNGSVNNYQFKSNGKTYRLQGNTMSLSSMINHEVEVTGEDFNGKAIQVNGARDLASSCKGK
jgi:hypothetical protein